MVEFGAFPWEIPSILNNGVDHTLIMALSRTLVRLRNEVAAIESRPLGELNIGPLCQPGVVRLWFLGRSRIRIRADLLYLITDNSLS